jgi:hypothetical protein
MGGTATYSILYNLLYHTALSFPSAYVPEVDFGDEYKNLSPPLRTLLSFPNTPFTKADLASVRAQRVLDRASALSIPYKKGKTVPGCTHRAVLHFTVEETKVILAACKSHSTTVTQIFHYRIAVGTQNLQAPSSDIKEGNYVGYVIMNFRKFCKELYNGPEYSMMLCHTNSTSLLIVSFPLPNTAPPTKQSPEEFRQVLEQVKAFYTHHSKPDLMSAPLCFSARTPSYPTSNLPAVLAPDSAPNPSLSSRGITENFIKHNYGPFEVLDPWAVGTEFSPGYRVSLATWKGKFALHAALMRLFTIWGRWMSFLRV